MMQSKLKSENQLQLLKYDALFAEIKHATGLTRLDDFVKRFENQSYIYDNLLARSKEYQLLTTRMRAEKNELQRAFTELKFSGEKRMSVGQNMLEGIADNCKSKKDASCETRVAMNENGKILVAIKAGLKTIFEKMINIGLPPPAHNRLTGVVETDIGNLWEKFDRLLQSLDKKEAVKVMNLPDLHEVLEQRLDAENIRVQLKKSTSSIESEFEYELQNPEEVPTRQDIKQKGEMLMESKVKPMRRKKKAKQ
jgi:hypothetical protein